MCTVIHLSLSHAPLCYHNKLWKTNQTRWRKHMDKCQLKVYQSRFWRSFVQKWFNFFKNQSKGTALRSPFHKVKNINVVGILGCNTVRSTLHIFSFPSPVVAWEKGWDVPHSAASRETDFPCYMYPKHIVWPCLFIFSTNNLNPFNCYIIPPPCCFKWGVNVG